jgi:hypothetical protein
MQGKKWHFVEDEGTLGLQNKILNCLPRGESCLFTSLFMMDSIA